MQTPQETHEFNFTSADIANAEAHSIETLQQQLGEMGWDAAALHSPESGGLRIELEPAIGRPVTSLEETIARIHGTLQWQPPQGQAPV